MTNQNEEIELETIERYYWVEQAQALERLENNEDFKKVILEGYFKDVALNQVSLLANEAIKRQGKRTDLMELLVAISTLQDHFHTIKNLGALAEDDLEQEIENEISGD